MNPIGSVCEENAAIKAVHEELTLHHEAELEI